MRFSIRAGKNSKLFVRIEDIQTAKDIEIHKLIEETLFRKEYKPFIQSFNKTVSSSYLFNKVWFPITFWNEIKTKIQDVYGIEYQLENESLMYNEDISREQFDEFVSSLKLPEKYDVTSETYKYQQECVFKALQNKIGRIEIGTSGGKTFITYMYCRYILEHMTNWSNSSRLSVETDLSSKTVANKILVIVPSKLLATQLKSDFAEYSSLEDNKVIVESIFAGSKKMESAHVLCGTYQSLSDYDKEFFDGFRFIICDELHRAKSYSIKTEIYDKITNADFFFGMTGTFPKYNTLDYLHITSMFGSNLYTKSVKSLIDDGVSVPVDLNIIKINYIEDKDFSKNLRDNNVVGIEKYHAEKAYFQSNPKRNEIITKLLGHFKDNALILVDTIEYGYNLVDLLTKYFHGERKIRLINGLVKNREEIIDEMKATENGFILIGTYGTMSTGVSISNIKQLYFVDGGKSEIRIRQSIGRGIRLNPGKDKCIVFDFYDNMTGSSFKSHANERIKIYKSQQLPFNIKEVSI